MEEGGEEVKNEPFKLVEVIMERFERIIIKLIMDEIKKIANDVYTKLGSGHTESVYHRAVEVEFRNRGVDYASEVVTPIMYKNNYVGYGRADIVLCNLIVIELKANVGNIRFVEENRVKTYMECLGMGHGIIINFPQSKYIEKKCMVKVI